MNKVTNYNTRNNRIYVMFIISLKIICYSINILMLHVNFLNLDVNNLFK